ncbi:TPA: transcriptional regulator [Serratia fonticola]
MNIERNYQNYLYLENDTLILNGSRLKLKNTGVQILLGRNQTKLMNCLIKGINAKKDIIQIIWGHEQKKSKENNYNQLVFQTRALLNSKGIVENVILTIPRYGLCLNKNLLRPLKIFRSEVDSQARVNAALIL